MEKSIAAIVDEIHRFNIAIKKTDTIGQLKGLLKDYKDYNIRMYVNPDTEIKIFGTSEYDDMNFETVWKQMENPTIVLKNNKIIMSQLETLDKNLVIEIALDLDLQYLLNLCRTSKRMNTILCDNNLFWRKKLDRDYSKGINVSNRFLNTSNFKEIYLSFYESKHVFSEEDFDKFDPHWRNELKKIDISIRYLYRVDEFYPYIEPKYKNDDENKEEEFSEYLMAYDFKRINGSNRTITNKLINIYNKRYGNEAKKEKKDNKYNKGWLGKDVLGLFHPLLVNEFNKYGIYLESQGVIISPNSKVNVEISSDT